MSIPNRSNVKFWCFTLNNPTIEPLDLLNEAVSKKKVDYIVFQKEQGIDEHTIHYQGYIELKGNQRMSWLRNNISNQAHWEPKSRNSTREQARDYCMKDDTRIEGPFEAGEWKEKNTGRRTYLTMIRAQVDAGQRMIQILPVCENFQQIRFAEKLVEYRQPTYEYKKKKVVWYWGPTDTLKTKTALAKCDPLDRYMTSSCEWMNGYYGESYVVFNDLRAKNFPYVDLLNLLDGYEIKLEIKGSFTIWKPEKIWITSPWHPEDAYYMTAAMEGGIEQLMRRITKCECIGEGYRPRENSSENLRNDRWNTPDLRNS